MVRLLRRSTVASRLAGASLWLYLAGVLLLGELAIRPFGSLTLSDMFFLLALISVLLTGILTNLLRLAVNVSPVVLVAGALFSIGGLASSVTSVNRSASIFELLRLDYVVLVWMWLGPQVIKSWDRLQLAMRMWSWSAAITGMAAVIQLVAGDVIVNTHIANGRMTGLTQHVNDLGGVTAIALAPSLAIATLPDQSVLKRTLSVIVVGAIVTGLLLSGSVTGFTAAAGGSIVWLLTSATGKRRIAVAGIVGGLAATTVSLIVMAKAVSPWERFLAVLGFSGTVGETGQTRLQNAEASLAVIRHHPFIGVGLDDLSYKNAVGDYVHNILLEAWVGGGLLAFVGIAVLIGFAMWVTTPRLHQVKDTGSMLIPGLLGSVVAFFVFGMGAPILLSRYAWVAVAMAIIVDRLASGPDATLAIESHRHNFYRPVANIG